MVTTNLVNPFAFKELCWPEVQFYEKQIEIIESVRDNDETFAVAGNMLGKDYVSAFIVLWFFCSRYPCRVALTSMVDEHLSVLWEEMLQFVKDSKYALDSRDGGQLEILNREIYLLKDGRRDPKSSIKAFVSSEEAGATMGKAQKFSGRHIAQRGDGIPRTLLVGDEASALPDSRYTLAQKWANRMLFIGNPWPCNNFFKKAVKGNAETGDPGGDRPRKRGGGYYRKIIHISAEDSPNVIRARRQTERGKQPDGKIVVPGVLPYDEYLKRVDTYDAHSKCVSLDGDWYEGTDVMMFPRAWLDAAVEYAAQLAKRIPFSNRIPRAMGIDTAMGGDNTCWAIVDDFGIHYMESKKTPDTTVVVSNTIKLMREYNLLPEKVFMDAGAGGGGKPHKDRLQKMGYNIRLVHFGAPIKLERKRGITTFNSRIEIDETKYAYKNLRAFMYGLIRLLLEPIQEGDEESQETTAKSQAKQCRFCLPRRFAKAQRPDGKPSLYEQLKPIPLRWDEEGRIVLLPKNNPDPLDTKKETLTGLIGCSPDEADALALAVYGRQLKSIRTVAGAA